MSATPQKAKQTDIHGEALNSARQFFGVFRYTKRALELLWSTSRKLAAHHSRPSGDVHALPLCP